MYAKIFSLYVKRKQRKISTLFDELDDNVFRLICWLVFITMNFFVITIFGKFKLFLRFRGKQIHRSKVRLPSLKKRLGSSLSWTKSWRQKSDCMFKRLGTKRNLGFFFTGNQNPESVYLDFYQNLYLISCASLTRTYFHQFASDWN